VSTIIDLVASAAVVNALSVDSTRVIRYLPVPNETCLSDAVQSPNPPSLL